MMQRGAWPFSSNGKRRTPKRRSEAGFSLIEVMVASTLLAVAVIGTGYFFVAGQSLIEGGGLARAALHEAVSKMKNLQGSDADPAELTSGSMHSVTVTLDPNVSPAITRPLCWWVTDIDDSANGVSSGQVDYKEIRVVVGEKADCSDTVPLVRLVGLRAE